MYYERITSAVLSQEEVLRATGISSLQNDPGLHQLLPYFVQLVAEKVTQNTRNLAVLESMMAMVRALLNNDNLFVEPYVSCYRIVALWTRRPWANARILTSSL